MSANSVNPTYDRTVRPLADAMATVSRRFATAPERRLSMQAAMARTGACYKLTDYGYKVFSADGSVWSFGETSSRQEAVARARDDLRLKAMLERRPL